MGMSDRQTEPTYRLVDLHPDVDVDAAASSYAREGWTFMGRGAICRVDGVAYRRVSVRRIGRPAPSPAGRRGPRQPYDVPPGWVGPLEPGAAAAPAR